MLGQCSRQMGLPVSLQFGISYILFSGKQTSEALNIAKSKYIIANVASHQSNLLQRSSCRTSSKTWCNKEWCSSSTYPPISKLSPSLYPRQRLCTSVPPRYAPSDIVANIITKPLSKEKVVYLSTSRICSE